MFHVEVDGQRLVDLDVLAGLDTAATENALVGIVGVEGVGMILVVRLALEFVALDRRIDLRIGVVQRAVAGVVLAQRAVQLVLGHQPIHAFLARGLGLGYLAGDFEPVARFQRAAAHQLAVDLNPADVAGLRRAQRAVITDVGKVDVMAG